MTVKKPKIKFEWKEKQLKTFWWWINERHKIYLAKKDKKPWPWTDNKILRKFKFTNVFRQLDRVTEEWTKRYVTILGRGKKLSDGDLLFQCAMFRLFNWPETYDALYFGMRTNWDMKKAVDILTKRMHEDHEQVFTGAYIIPNGGSSDPKIEVICRALDFLYDGRTKEEIEAGKKPRRHRYAAMIRKKPSMRRTVNILQRVPTIGGFIGYEIACDLRYTRLLHDAYDVGAWANPGPGAIRGVNRLLTGKAKSAGPKPDYNRAMRALLKMSPQRIKKHVRQTLKANEVKFEMREIEHSLCEFDKYMRVKNKEGRPRSIYKPKFGEQLDLFS